MILKMLRTQVTEIGTLRAGVAYTFNDKSASHKNCADRLLKAGFAEKTTEKKLDEAKASAEELAVADLTNDDEADVSDEGSADGAGVQAD